MTSRCGKSQHHSPRLRRRPDSIKTESSKSAGETIQFGARSRLSTSTPAEQSGRETNAKLSSAWPWWPMRIPDSSRSEERRVGKECRAGWWRAREKKKGTHSGKEKRAAGSVGGRKAHGC